LSNEWLVGFSRFSEILRERARWSRRNRTDNNDMNMKKTLIIAAVLGLATAFSVRAADAKANWDNLCAKCHGAEGKGDTKMGQKLGCKDFTDAKVQADIKDDKAFKALKEGLKSDDDKTLMKPFDTLTDDEIKALVAYVHTLKK
jgi:cytochrome c553